MKNGIKKYEVFAIADLCLDLLVSGPQKPRFGQVELLIDSYLLELGGSVGIFASQYAKLGGKIGIAGKIGNDAAGEIVLNKLKQSGVHTNFVEVTGNCQTSLGINLFCDGDRAMLTYLGTMDLSNPGLLTANLLSASSHWHIGSYYLLHNLIPAWPAWIKQLKENGVTVSLDNNWDPSEKWTGVAELLPMLDIFIPNEAEALAISGKKNVIDAGNFLAGLCPLVVIKTGERGAIVFTEKKAINYAIPLSLLKGLVIADTTGAGDNFDAGFIHGWLKKAPMDDCMQNAFCCAVSSLKALGGIEKQIWKST